MSWNMLDVSGYQANIPASVLNQADAVVVKVTEAGAVMNSDWKRQAQAVIDAGKPVGLYHFARAGDSDAQADAFLAATSGWFKGKAFPVLDWEAAEVVAYPAFAHDWLARVASTSGTTPVLYAGASDIRRFGQAWNSLKKWPLWLAAYPTSATQIGWGPRMGATREWAVQLAGGLSGWKLIAWQYTGTGRLSGWNGDLDMSELYVPPSELFKLAGTAGATSTIHQNSNSTGSGSSLRLPFDDTTRITQNFGDNATKYNLGAGHSGTDFAVPVGTEVKAIADGEVLWADWADKLPRTSWEDRWYLSGGGFQGVNTSGGIVVVLEHTDPDTGSKFLSTYAHLSKTDLNIGDTVSKGQTIGLSGATGTATGPHCHVEIIPLPANWANGGYYGRVNLIDWVTTYNATHRTAEETDIMANANEILAKLDKISKRQDVIWGGIFDRYSMSGKPGTLKPGILPTLEANHRDTWRMKAWLYQLWSTYRLGIPGVIGDGALGPQLRKALNYDEASLGKTRKSWYDAAKAKGFEV